MKKTVLVTGAAGGIGAAISERFAREGLHVIAADLPALDVRDEDGIYAFVHDNGPFDVVVNCAGGVLGQVGHVLEDTAPDSWEEIVRVNLTGPFLVAKATAPSMKRTGWGRIVNIVSTAGRAPSLTGIAAYTSAKTGLVGLTRQLAVELGPFGITVNGVAPGLILTNPATERQWESYGELGQEAHLARLPMRRLGGAEDIAAAVSYFAGDEAGWVTGQVLAVDGGQTMV